MIKLKRFKSELFSTMIPPNYQKVCATTDDYFDLIKYCWECIGDVSDEIVKINFNHSDSQYSMNFYKKSLQQLHVRINECYAHLKSIGNSVDISHVNNVYTAPKNDKGRR